jgi:hypothetical protein
VGRAGQDMQDMWRDLAESLRSPTAACTVGNTPTSCRRGCSNPTSPCYPSLACRRNAFWTAGDQSSYDLASDYTTCQRQRGRAD